MFTQKQKENFWSKLDKSGECWLFAGKGRDGEYGKVKIGGKTKRTHRLAWEMVHGETHLHILHTCDIPLCCNPHHLFEGTHADNMIDKKNKGRTHGGRGKPNPVKLDYNKAKAIRLFHKIGTPIKRLARMYGISPVHTRDIISGLYWR